MQTIYGLGQTNNWDPLSSSIHKYMVLVTRKGLKRGTLGPKSAQNTKNWYITPYQCKESHVKNISAGSYNQLGHIFIIHRHLHGTGGHIWSKNRELQAQKCPKFGRLGCCTLSKPGKSMKPYMSNLLQTIGTICHHLHAST